MLGGGLTTGRLYLIEGPPGAGKTTTALQFLLEGVRAGESGLYITLSETEQELHAVAASGVECVVCSDMRNLCRALCDGVGALAIAEEALA